MAFSIQRLLYLTGADLGFEKGGGAGGLGARPQDFFGQFRGLFKEIGAKRGGRGRPVAVGGGGGGLGPPHFLAKEYLYFGSSIDFNFSVRCVPVGFAVRVV